MAAVPLKKHCCHCLKCSALRTAAVSRTSTLALSDPLGWDGESHAVYSSRVSPTWKLVGSCPSHLHPSRRTSQGRVSCVKQKGSLPVTRYCGAPSRNPFSHAVCPGLLRHVCRFDSAEAGLCTQFAQLAFTLLSCKVIHECSGTLCAGAVQRRLCSFPAAEACIQELLTQGTTGSVLLWKPARISFVADSSMQRKLHQQQMPLAHENGSFLPPWCWYRVCEQPSHHGKRTAENLGACFSHSVRGLLANWPEGFQQQYDFIVFSSGCIALVISCLRKSAEILVSH